MRRLLGNRTMKLIPVHQLGCHHCWGSISPSDCGCKKGYIDMDPTGAAMALDMSPGYQQHSQQKAEAVWVHKSWKNSKTDDDNSILQRHLLEFVDLYFYQTSFWPPRDQNTLLAMPSARSLWVRSVQRRNVMPSSFSVGCLSKLNTPCLQVFKLAHLWNYDSNGPGGISSR